MNGARKRFLCSIVCYACALGVGFGAGEPLFPILGVKRVLLISIDGMHSLDLANYVKANPGSTLALLVNSGVNYTNASTTKPSDSIPAMAGIVTGGTPAVTGLYYDDAYNRALSPPGSTCATVGTAIDLKEGYDIDPGALEGGGGLDPAKLPRNPATGCTPVFPHNMIRVNTIFEVIKNAGLRTAYSEKRPSYEFMHGPSGTGIQDLYTPEIAYNNPTANATLKDNLKTQAFDELRVVSILNEIDGFNHSRTTPAPVPAIFGMNFQSINAAKKNTPGGYLDDVSNPTPTLSGALQYVDGALARMVAELTIKGLYSSTVIIITAKHGEAPLAPNRRSIVLTTSIPAIINGIQAGLAAKVTQKTASFIWLADQTKTAAVATALDAASPTLTGAGQILSGNSLKLLFPDPAADPAVPDVVVVTNSGVNYEPSLTVTSTSVFAEHGGFGENETHVPLVVSLAGFHAIAVKAPVQTTQIAPTILTLLKLNPFALQAVVAEETPVLPNILF